MIERKVSVTNAEGPPVPIPNTEVKLCSGDNTLRATAREDSSMLTQAKEWSDPLPRLGKKVEKANPKERSTESECNSSFLIPHSAFLIPHSAFQYGGVAQLGEHLPCKQGVMGSNPIISTMGRRSQCFGTFVPYREGIRTESEVNNSPVDC